jgi:GTPase SAR1 family protein
LSKKIIFVGPSGAGKTTLRKLFFEGENSNKLLEYALEPTYGEESLILRLPGINEDIGIFDLAGQENERWFSSDENSIFIETKVILVIVDISSSLDEIIEFIKKVLEVRENLTPETKVYVLLHKIDLVTQKQIRDVNAGIGVAFAEEKNIEFLFTSLKKEYFTQTFSYFIEIMKTCIADESSDESLIFNAIDESVKLIFLINEEMVIPTQSLHEKLNRPEKLIKYLVDSLVLKGHLQIKTIENQELVSLSDKGKDYFDTVLKSFSRTSFDRIQTELDLSELALEKKLPPFIGAFIADKDGRTLITLELFENALKKYLITDIQHDPDVIPVDLDLIPMFVSALEKFSLELNIQDLSGFGLKGSNLGMHIFSYDKFTVTFFMNPNVNIEPVVYKIDNYFKNLFEEYKAEFDNSLTTGQIDPLFPLMDLGSEWLQKLNEAYNDMIIKLEIYDLENAQELYNKIDELFNRASMKYALTLERIKKLKVNLMKAILENDYEELKDIAQTTQDLSAKYT